MCFLMIAKSVYLIGHDPLICIEMWSSPVENNSKLYSPCFHFKIDPKPNLETNRRSHRFWSKQKLTKSARPGFMGCRALWLAWKQGASLASQLGGLWTCPGLLWEPNLAGYGGWPRWLRQGNMSSLFCFALWIVFYQIFSSTSSVSGTRRCGPIPMLGHFCMSTLVLF